jgi:general stress protein YciG
MANSKRGFAAMDPAKQKDIASRGGRAAHAKGTAHEFSADEARSAGRKGGEAVSKDRGHMAKIGRAGGEAVSKDRGHMAKIGREGGEARGSRARQGAERPEDDAGRESRP